MRLGVGDGEMPRPKLRTRSRKRVSVRLPGGRTAIHYKREKPRPARCARCGGKLGGVPRLTPVEIRRLPANQRRPERIYGGQLCPRCLREALKEAARLASAETV